MNKTISGYQDKIELCRIDGDWNNPSNWNVEVETNNKPSILQRALCKLGLYNCAGDALTDYAINDIADHISTKYGYVSVGIDGTDGDVFNLNDLKSPVMTRLAATKSFMSTYNTDPATPDTAVWTTIFTSTGDYNLQESGLFTASTSGYMGARQVFYDWDVTNGEVFGVIWKVINSRG